METCDRCGPSVIASYIVTFRMSGYKLALCRHHYLASYDALSEYHTTVEKCLAGVR